MKETRIKISSIIDNQLPQFVREEFPLVSEFLSQYYISLENQGGTNDLLQNIEQYVKVDNLANLIESTNLSSDVTFFDSTINVSSTAGFPDSYGLLLIDSEIVTYTSKTPTTFDGCVRGFSGISSYESNGDLVFSETSVEEHISPTTVTNLSVLFLKEFFAKVKKQITPGFEGRELYSDLNERLFTKQAVDFYSSKGTDNSFKILFGALYGENVDIIRPRDYLIIPSSAQYRITSDLVVENIEGNPEEFINGTLYQYQNSDEILKISQGTVTKVENIIRGSKTYYVISLDSDYDKDIEPKGSIYGKFKIHPQTKITTEIIANSTTIEVDSTVGFPVSDGLLSIDLPNGSSLTVQYTSKTLNQFLGCTGVEQNIPISTKVKYDYFSYGYSNLTGEKIKVRILGVLSDLEIPENTTLYSNNDIIKIKTLGKESKEHRDNNWFFNIPVKYDASSIRLLDSSDKSYIINVEEDHIFRVGNLVSLTSSSGLEQIGNVISVEDKKSFSVQFGAENSLLDILQKYTVRKIVNKAEFENYSISNQYTSNVQNVYLDNEESLYVASPSIPSYLNTPLDINDRSVQFSGTFTGNTLKIGNHGFYTGDSVVYKPTTENSLGISSGIYFIKKVSDTEVKLAKSRSNIFSENFVSVNGTVNNAKFELKNFVFNDLSTQKLESQKLIRKIKRPEVDGNLYQTKAGLIGIFVNGVEILNYKSRDNIYYGSIERIVATSGGSGYDVINPPILSISDKNGSGANGYCSVIGGLERIDILDPGFDYLEEPKIEIIGGNGSGASAKVNLVSFDHQVTFNSISSAGLVKLNPLNQVGFSSYHKFRDAEEVVYITDSQTSVGGLSTNSTYFVSVKNEFNVTLHKSFEDAVSGINTIQLTSYGEGNHSFKSKNKKRKIGSIQIESNGQNYQNKLVIGSVSGINTASNIISIKDHGYNNGEVIVYNATEEPIGGLSSSTSYYVTKIDNDQFKLSQLGIGTLGIPTSFYFDNKKYVDLTSKGVGDHKFNYPEIKVSVTGRVGVSTLSGNNFNAIIQPIFRGEIQSVFVDNGGSNYGSNEIINYNAQPQFDLNSGSGAQLTPIILNGQIVDVLIQSQGSGYNSPPNLIINGDGKGALLSPVLSNGTLVEVIIIYGGSGYSQASTSIVVNSSGSGAKLEAGIKSWNINLVERLIKSQQITKDDGIISNGIKDTYGLQYTHAYAPRNLRFSTQATKFEDGEIKYIPDLIILDGKELSPNELGGSNAHSPIIGWAYDGNPIYGPNGFSSKTGGSIRTLKSGYSLRSDLDVLVSSRQRPNYPNGFFVEDYIYLEDGDLDESNGRFCITPEYPNGVYAYFATNESENVEESGPFRNYRAPKFPYLIGNTYKSKPIEFNFKVDSNQDDIDINKTNWKRNTTPYDIFSYEYLLSPNQIKQQNSKIKSVSTGSIESVKVENGGENYKIGDEIVFTSPNGFGAKAKVSSLKGKEIFDVEVSTSTLNNFTFYPYNNKFIGFSTVPHNYLDNDLVTFVGIFDYKKSGNITVQNNKLVLYVGVGSAQHTGIVTYFNVSGNLQYPIIRENDIYQIGDEQVKILNIDRQASRIRVIRNQNGTIGLTSYSAGFALTERSNKLQFNFGISTSYNFDIDREIYFDPKESIGLGTVSGVGIVSTLYFSNIGVGITQLTIPTQSIYIKNHNLITGDSLTYSANGGTQVSVSTDGKSSFSLSENSIVYVAKISNDLIGISTVRVGLGSNGTFVSVGSTIESQILYFTSVGTGNTHSFVTNLENNLRGDITKSVVTVTTTESHGLSLQDNISIGVKSGVSTTFVVKYNDFNRRLIINPRNFASVDTSNGTIIINNHGYKTGQKVVYNAATPSVGLSNNQIYYVVVVDPNKIRLSTSYYQAIKSTPETIIIGSSQPGILSQINPLLNFVRNQSILFDLSDSSLSFSNNGIVYSAFDLRFYSDSEFINEFDSTKSSKIFEIVREGKVGIDSTANIKVNLNDNFPNELYYKLVPINLQINSNIKKDIIIDDEVPGFNKISLVKSEYSGNYSIVGISSTTFAFNILDISERISPAQDFEYYVQKSSTSNGSINEITVLNGGRNYTSLPLVAAKSDQGSNSILKAQTNDIGKINSVEIIDIGFDYSIDHSVRPTANFPSILFLEPLSSLDYIGITSVGKNYTSAPSLVVIDGITNNVINDIELSYNLGDSRVAINKNSSYINSVTPKIIPINNSNGIKINNITFDDLTKDVTVTLGASFSDPQDYPFEVGSKVLIEGVSVGIASTAKGYNSSNYNYNLFTLTDIDPNIGGAIGVVTFNLSSYLLDGESPGSFDSRFSAGRIIPESYFPSFNPVLKKNNFYKGENVNSISSNGLVLDWNKENQYLKVSNINDFSTNELIIGETSGSVGIIKEIFSLEGNYEVNAYSEVRKGWNTETGFLNNDFQRVHDSDYYQYFSYALKSKQDFNNWNNPVSALNHTAGFKKFGNLILESVAGNAGISTNQNNGDFSGTTDLSRFVDLNCVFDFDLASENGIILDGKLISNEIIFNSRIIQDYIESVGNRVLMLDDISQEFNSNPRPTKFSTVESFVLNEHRTKKYFIVVQDKIFDTEKQLSLVVLLQDGNNGYLNQYGLSTKNDLGSFDFNITGNLGNLLFYPQKTQFNDYNIQTLSFSLNDIISGVGTINLGDCVSIDTSTTTIPQGTSVSTPIVGIASTYRSSKILVQIGATDASYYETDEIILINDGNDAYLLDYGQITTNIISSQSYSGIGTYNAYLDGSEVKIDITPNAPTSVDYVINTFNISIGNTSTSGIGTQIVSGSSLSSSSVGIASSSSPTENILAVYSNTLYNGSYFIASIEDKTNSEYQVSEFLVLTNSNENECYMVEFGTLNTQNNLGIVTAGVSGNNTEIYFTPNQDIEVDVKLFSINIGLNPQSDRISLENGYIEYDQNDYLGTDNDIRKEFILSHKNNPVFERYFDGSDSKYVNLENNTITIPNNFYVTGEEVVYSYPGVGTTQAIGIASTSIAGIGITDKLPQSLYIIKLDNLNVRVAASASEALSPIPKFLDLTSVGIGSSHLFTSKNQNKKVIIGIDNLIQSPISLSEISTTLSQDISIFDSIIYISSIDFIYGGDLIKIDDEIMRVNSVGVASTNSIRVSRKWLGTGLSTHTSSSQVTKIFGNYNIIGNKIYFSEAPYGKVPFTNPSTRPDEQDYIGITTGSTFSGRVFLRSGITGSDEDPYSKNYIFDNISNNFDGLDKTFELKSGGNSVTGISSDNAIVLINDIFQGPVAPLVEGDYSLSEEVGVTSITFVGSASSSTYDVNTASIPRGGVIISVASTPGFGYQPLVAAGGTAIVSSAGTIQSVSIGNSGSGYRSGIQEIVHVGVATSSLGVPNIEFIGTASVSNGNVVSVAITNPGIGYTSTNPPIVIFDSPLSYSNIPLVYSQESSAGNGIGAVVDIVVGQGSSIISFEMKNFGYGYKRGEILTVSVGGTTGIATDTSLDFSEFQISIDDTFDDKFASWTVGSLQVIDPIDSLFDGERKVFPILIQGNQTTIRSRPGSKIDVQSTLLIFINDVLQIPGQSYTFKGGSTITFVEAPKEGDTSKVLFYKGTENVDTSNSDILENVKIGDKVTLTDNNIKFTENSRLIVEIISSDSAGTDSYSGPGNTDDETLLRPVVWCRQTEDLFINGQVVGKDRIIYESYIQPSTNIIKNIDINSEEIFVESVKTFFDSEKEYIHDGLNELPQNKIIIVSQDSVVSASATAIVSASGTISSVIITSGGVGYSTTPTISISGPVGFGTTTAQNTASAIAIISGGEVTGISVTFGGSGYLQSQPPIVLIESPKITYESIDSVTYEGDFGIITGVQTTSVGVASTGIIFDFFIPKDSVLRDPSIVKVGIATTGISGIQTGYYFTINNSNIGYGITSLDSFNNIVGVGTSFINNVYQVAAVSIAQTAVPGIGITNVAKVTVSVADYDGLSGFGFSAFYGEYSWGRIETPFRLNPQEFNTYANIGGIATSPSVQRFNRLKYNGYSTT